jgi:Bacterial SH3 domain.
MPLDIMTVWSPNGKPVNLRNSFSRAAAVVAQMKVGSQVEVLGYPADGWAKVKYGEKTGYCMTEFLQKPGETAEAETALTEAMELIQKAITLLRRG